MNVTGSLKILATLDATKSLSTGHRRAAGRLKLVAPITPVMSLSRGLRP